MTISALDDIDAFLSDFAETVDIGGVDVSGIFDAAGVIIDDIGTTAPIFKCATTDISDWPRGTILTRDSVTYAIRYIPPDDQTGFTTVQLEKQ